eukprot:SAG22_NODE_231_length_14551_cov_22.298090_16_plen_34_part_00
MRILIYADITAVKCFASVSSDSVVAGYVQYLFP